MKENVASKAFEKLKTIVLLIVMIALPVLKLLSNILYLTHVTSDTYGIEHVDLLWIAIPALLGLYICGLVIKKDKINYLDIIMWVLSLLAFISTIFAVNVKVSIFGEFHRNEGLLSLVCYYLIFLNAKSIKDKKTKDILIKIFLYLGLFQVLHSIIEIYTNWDIVRRFQSKTSAGGLCGNPNFYASYMSMLVILTATTYIKEKNKKYLILSIIYNIGLTLSRTTGPFLAVIITLIFIPIYFHKLEYFKRIVLVVLVLGLSFFIVETSSRYVQEKIFNRKIGASSNVIMDLSSSYDQLVYIGETGDKEAIDRFGSSRGEIWRNLLPKVKDYWLVGAGIDNIYYIYPKDTGRTIDKAHNVYLQMLLTNGLPALITYCSLCLIIFIKGFKLNNEDVNLYMLFVVYSVQAFANISVIDVAPYFFLFFGLLASNFNQKLTKIEFKKLKKL